MTEPVRPLEALIAELLDQIQANVQHLDVHQMTGTFDGQEFHYVLVRRAQVHEILNTARAALLQAAAPPAPTAEPTIDEQVLRDLETRIFYAETSLKALVDSARLWKSLASTPAVPPERVSEGKAP